MKYPVLTILICLSCLFGFSQSFPKKQTLIPLSNVKGVPFYKDDEFGFIVDGFEIDEKNNFYFLGGDPTVNIAAFSGNKQLFRRTFNKSVPSSQILIYKKHIYTFGEDNNNLYVLDISNGSLTKTYPPILNKHINSYKFVDSTIIVEVPIDTSFIYEQYSLSGKYIKRASGPYDIPASVMPSRNPKDSFSLIGKWNNNYVFSGIEVKDLSVEKYLLVNAEGKILATRIVPGNNSTFGENYYESFPTEHRKVRNGNLYVLGLKGNNALITEVPLASLFGK
ncbi:MAG TPA: hypothetical protein VFE53_21185 [Mucilaginibacter sp.]|jgi:hypothetical protein|nr:hypothetical protein [Mucilaginibacter sp.]